MPFVPLAISKGFIVKNAQKGDKIQVSAPAIALPLYDALLLPSWKPSTLHWDFEVQIPPSTSTEKMISQDNLPS